MFYQSGWKLKARPYGWDQFRRKWVIVSGTLSVDNRDPLAFYQNLAAHYLGEKRLAEWRRTAVLERCTVPRLTP